MNLIMLDEKDAAPPDEELLKLASEAVEFVVSNIDLVTAIVLADHKRASEDPSNFDFDVYKIPRTVSHVSVGTHLFSRSILVFRHRFDSGCTYSVEISITPQWDEEHGLRLELVNGEIQTVNGTPFKIVDGKLCYD